MRTRNFNNSMEKTWKVPTGFFSWQDPRDHYSIEIHYKKPKTAAEIRAKIPWSVYQNGTLLKKFQDYNEAQFYAEKQVANLMMNCVDDDVREQGRRLANELKETAAGK